MNLTGKQIVVASPILIIVANFASAYAFRAIIGKWAFIPMILIGWTWIKEIGQIGFQFYLPVYCSPPITSLLG